MYTRCRTCKLQLPSARSLARHRSAAHAKNVRCALCYLRFASVKLLCLHYLKRHSKLRIIKQVMRQASQNVIRPLKWMRVVKKIEEPKRAQHAAPRPSNKTEKLIVKGNIHISYGTKDIVIELSSEDEESLEISIDDNPNKVASVREPQFKALLYDQNSNFSVKDVKSNEKLVILPENKKIVKRRKNVPKKPKNYKHFCIEFVKPNGGESLNHKTGDFYVCNCNEIDSDKEDIITVTSDTESSSDNGKYSFYPIPDKKIYCNICGNGYRTKTKLLEHRKMHTYHCRTCGTYYSTHRQFTNHVKNHVLIYCCHICKVQFPQKLSLINHLSYHQDRDIVKAVLDLEQNYSHYMFTFNSDSYASTINNITSFLSTNDYKYMSNYYKVRCHLCSLEFFKCDFPQHMKMHYFFKNSDFYFRPQACDY